MISAATGADVYLRIYENFVFYPPFVQAKKMLDAGEIGTPQMIRIHVGTGKSDSEWKVPIRSRLWRVREEKSSGGLLVFDHGYHLFSLAIHLMGTVNKVVAWIDHSPVGGILPENLVSVDAPATIMFQFAAPRLYGVMDFTHTPAMKMESSYYSDDNRVEIIGEKGIIILSRCTAKTLNLPAIMLFKDGKTREIPIERSGWHESFIDCTRHMIKTILNGGTPVLDGQRGKEVLQFALAAQISAKNGGEVKPSLVI
jgi:predicted dehydrogenase